MYKKEVQRKVRVTFRISTDERAEIIKKAKELFPDKRDNLSPFIRYCVLYSDTNATGSIKKELKEIKYQVRKLGVNLNQIAKVANETGYINQEELTELTRKILQQLAETDKKISGLLRKGE